MSNREPARPDEMPMIVWGFLSGLIMVAIGYLIVIMVEPDYQSLPKRFPSTPDTHMRVK